MVTHIEIGSAGAQSANGVAQVETGLMASQTITPSGTNQPTTFVLPNPGASGSPANLFATITADENIFLALGPGPTPDATVAGLRRAMAAGTTRSFAFQPTWQVAVVSR